MIYVTAHARARIRERLKVYDHWEIIHLARRAYREGTEPSDRFKKTERYLANSGFSTYFYKNLNNHIFVFHDTGKDLEVVTVYHDEVIHS